MSENDIPASAMNVSNEQILHSVHSSLLIITTTNNKLNLGKSYFFADGVG